MKVVYHIHDECCGHATNTLETVVDVALNDKYQELFFTEHSPLDNNHYIYRPSWEAIKNLRKRIAEINNKYHGRLFIHFGFEAEYSKDSAKYFHDLSKNYLCDYLIFGNHYLGDMWGKSRLVMDETTTTSDLDEYCENSLLALKSGLFSLYAHPDIWINSYKKWDEKAKWLTQQLITQCLKYKMPMGFNGNGLYKKRNEFDYPYKLFWAEVAKTKIKVLIEADAHDVFLLKKPWLKKVRQTAIDYGLKNNLVDTIEIKYFK